MLTAVTIANGVLITTMVVSNDSMLFSMDGMTIVCHYEDLVQHDPTISQCHFYDLIYFCLRRHPYIGTHSSHIYHLNTLVHYAWGFCDYFAGVNIDNP